MLTLKTNLRCDACVQSIQPLLDAEPTIDSWTADVSHPDKLLTIRGEDSSAAKVNELLALKGYRVLAQITSQETENAPSETKAPETSPTTYRPLLLILCYLLLATAAAEIGLGAFELDRSMRHFMAGFFLVFSFFKLFDLSAFAMTYSSYDLIARRWPVYGYVYPFIELTLGTLYLANFAPILTNLTTLLVMGISTIGVAQAVFTRQSIRCACLGAFFNLPMSSVTLVEDLLMVAMAIAMLSMMIT